MITRSLKDPVTKIYGIGEAVANKLAGIGVTNVFDLLNLFPRKYEDWSSLDKLYGLSDGQLITFKGTVRAVGNIERYDKLQKCKVVVSDDYGTISITFFHGRYVASEMKVGDEYFFRGVLTTFRGSFQLVNPQRIKADKMGDGYIRPVYRQTAGITSKQIEAWMGFALRDYSNLLENILPAKLILDEDLCSVKEAYKYVHKPESFSQIGMARKRLAYDELACYDYGLRRAYSGSENTGHAFKIVRNSASQSTVKGIVDSLPFALTDDQKKVIREIFTDMASDKPMNRLVQGDVGSGKTCVAAVAMAAVAASGRQACLLAPTGVLAKQHYDTVSAFYKDTDIKVVYLHGGMKAKERNETLAMIKSGEARVIIGTHAVIQKDVEFYNLALFITDEQQRFGVVQRNEKLSLSYINSEIDSVHNLVMSATPIPRTLAMVVYGDMAVSIIRQKPAGRKTIKTYKATEDIFAKVFKFLSDRLKDGEQAYIVAPKIDDNDGDGEVERYDSLLELDEEKLELNSVKSLDKKVRSSALLKNYTTGTLVGSMSDKEKTDVMDRFTSGEIKILISTTVVEVGVNNPNATCMVIMDADRFGLSTLHQLRGRVGRGDKQSYCILASSSKSPLALERLNTMCAMDDGFALAEKDLELRGPGDFFGTRQHGLPDFKAVNVFEDAEKSVILRDHMAELFAKDDDESKACAAAIERQMDLRYPNLEILRA